MLVEEKNTVEQWVDFLGKEHMPALAETVQKLGKLTTDEDSRVSQLTDQILKDPSLTSRVLQVSNSVVYKGLGGNIKTITRAIVMLGFTTIRDISLSMQILDNVLKNNPSQHLMYQIANAFHGAMQARAMLTSAKAPQLEEVFISTLLLHFAELAMLSRDDETSRKLNQLLASGSTTVNEAAKAVLGCSFDQISLSLARQWEMSELLIEALSKPRIPSRAAHAILLADELSTVAVQGWNSNAAKKAVEKIAGFREVSFEDAMASVRATADTAQELAVHYGASKVRHLIPGSGSESSVSKSATSTSTKGNEESNPVSTGTAVAGIVSEMPNTQTPEEGIEDLIEMALSGGAKQANVLESATARSVDAKPEDTFNVQLQMEITQRLNQIIADKKVDVNQMLDLVLSGMQKALGLERVVMALVSKDRKYLLPKFFKGSVDDAFKASFRIDLQEENAFSNAIRQSQLFWMGSRLMAGRGYLHTDKVQALLGCNEYFVAPIIVSRRPIGVFYGDCSDSKRPLNDQQYAGFSMLAQQAGMALSANQK